MIKEAFFNDFLVKNLEFDEDKVLITLNPTNNESNCPCCEEKSYKIHSRYRRKLLDLPMLDKSTKIILNSRRFFCNNPNCSRKIFSEQFKDFITRYKRNTKRLSNYLFRLGLSQSASQACRLLGRLIPISVSSILRIVKNNSINVSYNAEHIGIDDFSFKKGVTFGTIICNLNSGKPIDIIDSRNLDEVTEHLKLYKNAKIVSRDRSTTYAKVINNALPNASQIADRFHIIHNFFEGIGDFLKRYIGKAVKINKNINKLKVAKNISELTEKREQRKRLILKIKELHMNGMPIKEIVRKTSVSRNTVRKYINIENVTELSFYDTPTPFYTYRDLIITLLIQNKRYKEILVELENKGVKYSYSSLAKYANALKKSGMLEKFVDGKSYTFTRFNLMKIFWNYNKNTKNTFKLLAYILDDYPLIDYIFLAVATFKEVFESKDPLKLDEWIEFYHTYEIKEIRIFINGVKKITQA